MNMGLTKQYILLTVLFIFLTNITIGQLRYNNTNATNQKKDLLIKKSKLGLEILISILPGGKITREEGNYRLRSHPQSTYEAGINYIYHVNQTLSLSSGLHLLIGIRNFFANIPDNDISGYSSEPPIIEDKTSWSAIKIPLLIEKRIDIKKIKTISLKAGLNIQYTGFMQDESIDGFVIDSNRTIHIFNAELSVSNNNRPWITFLVGASKPFVLDNKNILSVGLLANLGTKYFYNGKYIIMIPNRPRTLGSYKINGSSLGLSVQYIFTGTNKRLIRNYQRQVL